MKPVIELRGVSKHFRLKENIIKAVDDVSMRVEGGDFIMVTGPSGSGKTTLLSLMGGLSKPTSGVVLIDNIDIGTLGDKDLSNLRSHKMGFIFQFPSLIPTLNVIENVMLPAIFTHQEATAYDRARQLINRVGLEERVNAYPSQLSMGQQKRAAIARALMNEPKIILADEPTSDLDEATGNEVMHILRETNKIGVTVLMVAHRTQLPRNVPRSFVMTNGVLSGSGYSSGLA